jgi:signal transduction histidine kinase
LARCGAEDVLDVIQNHRFTLAYREAALGIVESGALRLANARLRKLNEELDQRVQQRTAELGRALRVQEAFLSVASHELKTPVTSLHLHLDALLRAQRRSLSPDELEKRLHKAREQCKRVETLVDRLLDVSQAGTGRLPLHIEEVNLGELARTVVEQLSEQAERARCTVRVKVDGTVLGHWDRTRVEQVVLSLLSNAFKYAPGSPVEVTVQRLGDQAVLRVRDEGMGISAKDQQRIFERFTPVSPGPRASGFGLGLWMVRQTVEALGGRIEVASELGRGAVFTVTLPLPGSLDPSQGLSGRG